MYTPEDSPFEKFRTEKLKGVAMSPDVLELVAKAYEGGFIDGMQKQMQSSVDRAVNRMAEQPAQQQEPVAYVYEREIDGFGLRKDVKFLKPVEVGSDLYTSPPASKPWVGLTRDERMSIINRLIGQDWVYALDAIEAKLKEKNA